MFDRVNLHNLHKWSKDSDSEETRLMFGIELIVVFSIIYLGGRLGSIGIGFSGGLGVLALTFLFQIKPGAVPFDVIETIMAVIVAISTVQVAGGVDYLVNLATKKMLRRHPKYITFFAPLFHWFISILAGTGHIAFSTLEIIAEVAKEQGIRPSRPLSISVVASQIAITASPVSAAVVFFSGLLEPMGISYLTLLEICIPSTLIALMITAIFCNFLGCELQDDPIYQKRLIKGEVKLKSSQLSELKPYARRSIVLFCIGIIAVMLYSTAVSNDVESVRPVLSRNEAFVVFMLAIATIISVSCKIDTRDIPDTNVFKSGMSACVSVLGAAWLGDTFMKAHIDDVQTVASDLLRDYPWLLSVMLFFSTTLLYSQTATTKALMPVALTLGVTPLTAIASFSAVSALFILPTYPTLLAAVEIDDTGSTRIGKYLFNHDFLIPGVIAIVLCSILEFLIGGLII